MIYQIKCITEIGRKTSWNISQNCSVRIQTCHFVIKRPSTIIHCPCLVPDVANDWETRRIRQIVPSGGEMRPSPGSKHLTVRRARLAWQCAAHPLISVSSFPRRFDCRPRRLETQKRPQTVSGGGGVSPCQRGSDRRPSPIAHRPSSIGRHQSAAVCRQSPSDSFLNDRASPAGVSPSQPTAVICSARRGLIV